MRFSAHISWLFAELPYIERVAAARRAGFGTIESAWPDDAEDRAALPGAVAAAGVEVALLNAPAGDVARGERGFVNDPARREEAERAFAQALELARALGAPHVNVLVGRALPGVPVARQRAAVVAALRAFAPVAAAAGVRIVLEPLNANENPGFLAPSVDDALALIEEAGETDVGVLFDCYHVARDGGDPLATIARHGERIWHVQLSDFPGRGAPGTGTLDFAAILDALAASGYDGAVGLEYEAGGDTRSTLGAVARLASSGALAPLREQAAE